jgi:TetR/AcrR family transcriptional regulator, cholesterol catabolism regulator
VDGASLRAIAADARTSIGMVYYYFATKDDLFLAVVEESYATLLADIAAACDPKLAPRDRLRRMYRRIAASDERELQIVRLVLREALVSSKRLGRVFARFQRGHIPIVIATIADGIRDRSIRSDVQPLMLLLIAISVGAIPQFMMRFLLPVPGAPAGDALADALVDLLWNGIGVRSSRGRRRAATSTRTRAGRPRSTARAR